MAEVVGLDGKVVDIGTPFCKDPVAELRRLADEIEAGDWGAVDTCAVVIMGDTLEVFGSGTDSAGPSVAVLLQAGILRIARAVERHGRD